MIFLPSNHPSISRLKAEGISITDAPAPRAATRILILNLMPQKQEAEEEHYRMFSHADIDIKIVLGKMSHQTYKTTPQAYMDTFYTDMAYIMGEQADTVGAHGQEWFEGMIVTGAPLEHLAYTDVRYWQQLKDVYHWSFSHVRSTLNICWGAFAALKMFFGIDKHWTERKLFGVFPHHNEHPECPLMEGMPGTVAVPISRHITLLRQEMDNATALTTILDSPVSGPELAIAWHGRHIFSNGHFEYAATRLDFEYRRDMQKGLDIDIPAHYYFDDDPQKGIDFCWQNGGIAFYTNWLRHYVCNPNLPQNPSDIVFHD